MSEDKIAFQGEPGAYSHQACRDVYPDMTAMPCATFEEAIGAVQRGEAKLAMLPVENSLYGRVADVHHLLPGSGLYIIGEHFLPIRLQLLGVKDATIDEIDTVQSHVVALGQCRVFIQSHKLNAVVGADTAGSAKEIAAAENISRAAIASTLAAEIYGLKALATNIEDAAHNTTRFLVASRQKIEADRLNGPSITTFVFRVRNLPSALYKAMGGFATNGVNMVKLESYMVDGQFTATQFYADIEGHPDDPAVARALEELHFFTSSTKILGVYPASAARADR
ncbi:MAG: prephenate dehydratase [Rhodobacteraceae bacterium]|nr:prephenate dehydratase [Paracoccaceae bacterium]